MKRILVASILGVAASVATSYGQATYSFDTYAPLLQPYGPSGIVLMPGGATAGLADNIVGNLLWTIGTDSGVANSSPVQLDTYGFFSNNFSPNAGPGTTQVSFLPSYVSLTDVDFTVEAWDLDTGASYAAASVRGSISWTDPGMVAGSGYATFDPSSFPAGALQLSVVPEPSMLALAGLGLATMIFRKRQ